MDGDADCAGLTKRGAAPFSPVSFWVITLTSHLRTDESKARVCAKHAAGHHIKSYQSTGRITDQGENQGHSGEPYKNWFFGNSPQTAMPNMQLDIISIHRITDQSGHQGHSQSCLKRRRKRQKKSCFHPILIYDINAIFLFLDPPSRCFSRERVANSGIYEMSPFPAWKPQPKPPLLPIYRFPLNKFPIPIPRFSILSYSPANQNTFPCQCPSLLTDTKKAALLPVWSWWEIGCFHREPSSKNLNPQCQKQDLPSQMNYKECKFGCNIKIRCTFKCHF